MQPNYLDSKPTENPRVMQPTLILARDVGAASAHAPAKRLLSTPAQHEEFRVEASGRGL